MEVSSSIISKLSISFIVFGIVLNFLPSTAFLVNGGHYRLRSLYDGLYASAGVPVFHPKVGTDLGNITTEKWGNYREQRFDLIGLDQIGKLYWLFSQENTFNKLSAGIINDKPDRHISELISVELMDSYLIRSTLNGNCLENPGYGLPISFQPCQDTSVRQQWEFDRITQ